MRPGGHSWALPWGRSSIGELEAMAGGHLLGWGGVGKAACSRRTHGLTNSASGPTWWPWEPLALQASVFPLKTGLE